MPPVVQETAVGEPKSDRPKLARGSLVAVFVGIVLAGLGVLAVNPVASGPRSEPLSPHEKVDLIAQLQISTVRVAARACPGVVRGSGFVVDGLLFTSGHIAQNDDQLKVDRPGQPVESLIMATSASLDVSVADATGVIAVEMRLANTPAPEGETVLLGGFPEGGELEAFEATVARYAPAKEWGVQGSRVMLLHPAIRSGFSGGPVLDRDGNLVGMLAGVDSVTGLAVAIPSDELSEVVRLAVETWVEGDEGNGMGSVAHAARPCNS
jgi:S1-C subfamily serine protease